MMISLMDLSRRGFLEFSALTAQTSAAQSNSDDPLSSRDGPPSPGFAPILFAGNTSFGQLAQAPLSAAMQAAAARAPRGSCVCWGIPFDIRDPLLLVNAAVTVNVTSTRAGWLVFLHTTDLAPLPPGAGGLTSPMRGEGRLAELAAQYSVLYSDGSEERIDICRRHHVGSFRSLYGDNCFQAVGHVKPFPVRPLYEQSPNFYGWGGGEMRGRILDRGPWINWLFAWRNPHPDRDVTAIRFEPRNGPIVVSGLAAGNASVEPLQWRDRRKAVLTLPQDFDFDFRVDRLGRRLHLQLDMGQVISVDRRRVYSDAEWLDAGAPPRDSAREILVEYTSHPDARFHLWDGTSIPVAAIESAAQSGPLVRVPPASQRVRIRVLDKQTNKPVPVRLHLHGENGEYLAPLDRHRWVNPSWFEDYGPDHLGPGRHISTYIDGETVVRLPLGAVYLEITKGFEIQPVRRKLIVGESTGDFEIVLDKVLPWRERGWITADTHVHFLTPQTARLEGSAEGVNVVNLLASQWGELFTNVGDFDGATTFGSRETGGDGEWLVRVGSENRQRVLGHLSLLGYRGRIITPMCAGGPDEAAVGDPVGVLLMEWAEQCRRQGGLVVLPHFPNPRAENAAALVEGLIDGVEMSATPHRGIDPYCLSDYYRYLNCGYFVPAVGGTDKMSTQRAVGDVRTYSRTAADKPFSYESWMDSVRAGNTFATCGPLLEFTVAGRPPGARIHMPSGGGTLDVVWEAASVALPMTRIDLVINGEIRESHPAKPGRDSGRWSVRVDRSSWLALLIRGASAGQREFISAHSSPVMVHVEGSEFFSPVDAITMLDQIDGALAYIDTVGTRAEDEAYKRMRLRLTAAYRKLHDELHRRGHFHGHTGVTRHE